MAPATSGEIRRWLELGAFVVGVGVAAAYVVFAEIIPIMTCAVIQHDHGFPWGVALLVGACVIPITAGKATAGKFWDKLPSFGGRSGPSNDNGTNP